MAGWTIVQVSDPAELVAASHLAEADDDAALATYRSAGAEIDAGSVFVVWDDQVVREEGSGG